MNGPAKQFSTHFFPLKSSQRFTGTIQKRNQNSLEEDWMLHSRNTQLYVYLIRGPTKAMWFHSLFSTYYYLILSCSLICSTVYYYLPHLNYKLSESKNGICLVLCSTSNTQHGVRQTVNVKSGSLKSSWMAQWDKAKKTQLFPFISLYAIYPMCWSLWLFSSFFLSTKFPLNTWPPGKTAIFSSIPCSSVTRCKLIKCKKKNRNKNKKTLYISYWESSLKDSWCEPFAPSSFSLSPSCCLECACNGWSSNSHCRLWVDLEKEKHMLER